MADTAMSRIFLLCLLLLSSAFTAGAAQDADLRPGARIRFWLAYDDLARVRTLPRSFGASSWP
jgi:hypothetical protein